MKTIMKILLLSLLIPVLATAQLKSQIGSSFDASTLIRKPAGLLDKFLTSGRFSMSHTFSMSYFSLGSRGFNQALYLNTMSCRISDPLFAKVQIGYLQQPFGNRSNQTNTNGTLFVRQASISYKPSNKVTFLIDYQSWPSPMLSPYTLHW